MPGASGAHLLWHIVLLQGGGGGKRRMRNVLHPTVLNMRSIFSREFTQEKKEKKRKSPLTRVSWIHAHFWQGMLLIVFWEAVFKSSYIFHQNVFRPQKANWFWATFDEFPFQGFPKYIGPKWFLHTKVANFLFSLGHWSMSLFRVATYERHTHTIVILCVVAIFFLRIFSMKCSYFWTPVWFLELGWGLWRSPLTFGIL